MFNNLSGVTRENAFRHANFLHKLGHPTAALGYGLDRLIQERAGLKRRLRRALAQPRLSVDNQVRTRFYRRLECKLDGLRLDEAGDPWAAYYEELGPQIDRRAKLRVVGELLDRLRPRSVADLGCNTGVFSVLAAERGARVISIDSSEACVSRLYARAKQERLDITPVVSELLSPTPAFGFMATQYPSLIERAAAEVVLSLAVMHHLHVTGRQSLERIASLMDALAERHLIFEFVAMDDPNIDLLGAGRRIDYDLVTVQAELRRFFPVIETLDSDRPTRKILLCSKDEA